MEKNQWKWFSMSFVGSKSPNELTRSFYCGKNVCGFTVERFQITTN